MNANYETFLLYYVSCHEGEFVLSQMKQLLLAEIGEAGLLEAVAIFRSKRLERESQGIYKTLYETMGD